jgi:LmbE family N-acetylglucosaminyl deacetylase
VFLAPHNDDETLFGAFTLLRERPRVITILRSHVQEARGVAVTHDEREAETAAALEVLGIGAWEQWTYSDLSPPWSEIRERLASLRANHVFAPSVDLGGHKHHNAVGALARMLWPGRVTFYTTYTNRGRTTRGHEVPWKHDWALLKLQALACYQSQIVHPETRTTEHFLSQQREYYARRLQPSAIAYSWLMRRSSLDSPVDA